MTEIYFKEENIQYPAEEYFKKNMNKYMDILTITKKYLDEKLRGEAKPTEINFVKYPYLGEELFEDDRIVSDKLLESREDYNQIGGVAIYIKNEEDQNQILKEEYRALRLSYISIVEHYNIIENIMGAIHELNHFRDPFDSSVNFVTAFYEEGYHQDTELFIQFTVRDILNEYYANYRAYKYLRSILITLNMENFDIGSSFGKVAHILVKSLKDLKEGLISIKTMDENYYRFNQYLSICFKFFRSIFRFFGKWHGLKQDYNDLEKIFVKIWEAFIEITDNNSYRFLIYYLESINSTLNHNFIKTGDIEEFYDLFYDLGRKYPEILNNL